MTKKTVNVVVNDAKNSQVTTAGGNIGKGSASPTGEDVEVQVNLQKIDHVQVSTAAGNITAVQEINEALSQIFSTLKPCLTEEQSSDLQGIVDDVQTAAQQPPEQRNGSKLRRLLGGIDEYVGLAALAASQAQQIVALVDKVKALLGIG